MRVHDQFLKTVAFLFLDESGKKMPVGTAFFVSVGADNAQYDYVQDIWSGEFFTYAVTARHCIEDNKGDPPIFLRINLEGGGHKYLETRKGDWAVHPNADVAVRLLRYRECPSGAALDTIAEPLFVDPDNRCRRAFGEILPRVGVSHDDAELIDRSYKEGIEINIGDDLFFPSLFVHSAGQQRNLPIVRFGNIARMPNEELIKLKSATRGEFKTRAFLAEVHSWGGHSGSPVFWHYDLALPMQNWVRALLGLVSAHFDIKGRVVKTSEASMKLNSGIAAVTPIENVKELLIRPDAMRERIEEQQDRDRSEP
ncbi:MAG TPA: hypothetical protein VN865_09820, partial [Candidatus Acidoferrales bacterium]|nr:hypothetical protein [Candidatus Acidoferrales bacterium]